MDIGNGQFWRGDCLELMADIPDGSVDMVLTDVPYNEVNRKSSGLRNLDKSLADSAPFDLEKLIRKISTVCSGSAYIFCGTKQISPIIEMMEDNFSIRLGTWRKTNPSPMNGNRMWLSGSEFCVVGRKSGATFNEHCKGAVWDHKIERSKIHPTQKPVGLFERLISASTNPGDVVLDPFAGSGTTAIAAERTNRKWICIERDREYYEKACERVKDEIHRLI